MAEATILSVNRMAEPWAVQNQPLFVAMAERQHKKYVGYGNTRQAAAENAEAAARGVKPPHGVISNLAIRPPSPAEVESTRRQSRWLTK